MLVLLMFPLLLLVLFRLDAVPLLHFAETQRVRHQRFICRLFLLLNSKQGILANLSSGITNSICILGSNEILVGGADLIFIMSDSLLRD